MPGEEGGESLKLVLHYKITPLGLDAFEAAETLGKAVADARRAYMHTIHDLAIKYELSPETVNKLAVVFLNPLAVELLGFGTPVSEEMQQLRSSNEELLKRLPEINLVDLLQEALEKRQQTRTE